MTPEAFFEKFDRFADAPDAVVKMRELVLELAVRGRLSERRASDHGNAAWHEFIEECDHRIYDYDPGPPPPFEIPNEWRWECLADAADCRAAAKVSPLSIKDNDWVLDLEDIDGTTGEIVQFATFAERSSLSTKAAFEPGDVLYGKLRPYLNKVVVAAKRGFCTTEIIPLRPATFLTPEFLRFYLRSQTFLRYAAQKNYGMKMPRLGTKDLESAEIPVPPPAEQKRIVAKVDELMALCDRLEAQQQERETRHTALARASLARFAEAPTPANLPFLFHSSFSIHPSDLRKSILTLAVQGKLVPQDPNDEPAEVPALSRVTKSKGEREAPFELPGNWKWMQLGQVSELINGDRSKNYPNKAEYVPEGVAWINTGHIEPDGTLSTEWMHFITRKKFDSLRSGKVRPGDLVYCLRGATLGKTAIITQYEEGAVASSLVIIRLIPAVEPRFAYRFLTSPLGREQIFQFDNGSAQPNLSANSVKKYWVPIPPLVEQRRIVAKVEQLMALVDALETQLAAARATAANLLSALVAELTAT